MNNSTGLSDCARDPFGLFLARLHNPESDALRGAGTDARHLPQLLNQIADRGRIFRPSHSEASRETGGGSAIIFKPTGSSRRRYICRGWSTSPLSPRARLNSAKDSFQRRSRKNTSPVQKWSRRRISSGVAFLVRVSNS